MDPKRALLVEKIGKMIRRLRKRKEGLKVDPSLQNKVVISSKISN